MREQTVSLATIPRAKGQGLWEIATIDGKEWEYLDYASEKRLRRSVPAGAAEITEIFPRLAQHTTAYRLSIELQLFEQNSVSHSKQFDTLEEATEAAEFFRWITVDYAGRTWYRIRDDDSSEQWEVHFGPGHHATAQRHKHGPMAATGYWITHHFSPRAGEYYEIKASRVDFDGILSIHSFVEAAAIAYILPDYVSTLMQVRQVSAASNTA